MANRQTQDESEYQDSLRITQSMLGEISRAMAETANSTDGRNRALGQQLDITRDILNSISDVRDYERTINQLLTQQTQINNTNYGINERLRQVQLAQLDAALGILRAGEDTEKVLTKFNISITQLPKIKINDPAIPPNTQIGDVIKIERKEEDDTFVYYRVVSI